MPLFAFALALLVLVAAAVAFPLGQAVATHGLVYYANGNDEASYLQYDFARSAASPMRPGQLLVVAGHQLGLSGGWVNLAFDVALPVAFALAAWLAFRQLGWDAARARLAALALATLPLLVSAVNPALKALSRWCVRHGYIYWWNMVEQPTPALLRTPEPQLSWLVVALGVAAALRLRSAWPVLLVTPCTYPFVGVPVAFVALAWELHRRWPWGRWGQAGPLAGAYLAIGLASAVVYQFATSPQLRLLLVDTHLPMLSLSALMAILVYAWLQERMAPGPRFVALATAVAPLAACNVQVVSGHIGMPCNFEQYAGIVGVALVYLLGAGDRPRPTRTLVAAGYALFLASAAGLYQENAALAARLPLDQRLLTALREDPRHTAINDVPVSSLLNLLFPREATTALAYNQAFPGIADRYLDEYRAIRGRILREQGQDAGFRGAIADTDHCYLLGSQDYVMANMFHKVHFVHLPDPTLPGPPALERPLRYFFVTGEARELR